MILDLAAASVIGERHIAGMDYKDSTDYRETGDFKYMLAGNGPFLIEKEGGRIYQFGTAYRPEKFIEEYERNSALENTAVKRSGLE